MRWSRRAAIGAMVSGLLALSDPACAPFDADVAWSQDPDASPREGSTTSADASSGGTAGEAAAPDASASIDAGVEALVLQKTRSTLGAHEGSSATFGLPIAAGSLVAVFAYGTGNIDLRISDSDKNAFTALTAVRDSMGSGRWFYCDHAIATGKVDVVTLTVSPASFVYGLAEIGRDDYFMFLAEAQVVPSGKHRASVQFPGLYWGISAAAFPATAGALRDRRAAGRRVPLRGRRDSRLRRARSRPTSRACSPSRRPRW